MDGFTYDKATIWSVSFILLIRLRVNASTFWYASEKFGPRKMITIALVWWSAFTIFTGMIKHHGLLYLVRFLFGIGEAPMYPSNACLMQTGSLKMRKVEHLVCYSAVLILDLY